MDPAALRDRLRAQGFSVHEIEGMASFFQVDDGPRPLSQTLEHWSGHLYVQQASTGVAAPTLGVSPGDRVLDLCASPGGKLIHLAELMDDRGSLVACEIDERRTRGLLGNLYRLCVRNAIVVAGDGRTLPEGALFDRVLVDAPCSGEGTLRRRAGEIPDQSKAFMAYVTRSQRALLERAVRLTRPGGAILYVTCTFAPEENEAVVSEALARGDVDLEPLVLPVPHARGLTSFEGARYDRRLEGAARIYPHHLDSGGLFLAKLRRVGGDTSEAARDVGWSAVPSGYPADGRDETEAHRIVSEAVDAIVARFDVDPAALRGCRWMLRADTVWLHTCAEWPIESWQPNGWRTISLGLRAIEIDTSGRARPTNDLLRFLARGLRAGVVDLDAARMARLLDGAPEPSIVPGGARPGPTALSLDGEVVGRGRIGAAGLVSEIPKARAQDLARALAPAAP